MPNSIGTVAACNAAGGSLAGVAHRMAAMAAAALSAREAVQFLKATVETGIKFDSLKTQYSFANNGDTRKAADEMAYAAQLSNRLGLELVGTTQAYGKLQAAARGTALEGQVDARHLYRRRLGGVGQWPGCRRAGRRLARLSRK